MKILTYFCLQVLQKIRENSQFVKQNLKNEAIINISFLMIILSLVIMNQVENDDEISIGTLIGSQIILAFAVEFGSQTINNQIKLIMGSEKILMSWNPYSPSHNREDVDSTDDQIEIWREQHYKRYLCYKQYFELLETLMRIFGVIWALVLLIPDKNGKHWYSKDHNLTNCINVTFGLIVILIFCNFVTKLIRSRTQESVTISNISFRGFMGLLPDDQNKVEHLSYEIERYEVYLRNKCLEDSKLSYVPQDSLDSVEIARNEDSDYIRKDENFDMDFDERD